MLRIAIVQLKPGTGKTTSAVWLAYAFHRRGLAVALADADKGASALEWSDQAGGFPFAVAGLPVKDFHNRADDIAAKADVVIGDVPQIEDHAGIARSAMRWADIRLIPVAPTGIELDRMAPISDELEDMEPVLRDGSASHVLLNRVVSGASSTGSARRVLTAQGHDVLTTTIPRLEVFAQSFGAAPSTNTAYDQLATELLERRGMA
ncbi:ParA family protein [Streptomyces sp. ME02-6979.5a]|uniref:ParA family protein n=1 Tax=unclassified Streptomyces TaxID=2593676 RepID=UPI0029A7FC2B|nr:MULTISPECIES: ParA family protein [unclassified Streptomyces]MDX3343735.1 ParA family protein [Streptomyces sp. ME02-6979.5a]MDX5526203.1 ParA family protein [Streptomyces sp. DE06-01C]